MTIFRQPYKYFIFLGSLVFFLISSSTLFAATDDFTVGTFIDDTTAPTTPTLNDVIPISTDQVDLSWSSSTDNWILNGYHVWRDGVQIATTSSLSYSDTGLTPDTLYSYYVTAYDSFLNESASSTEIATTTYEIPPIPTSFGVAPISDSQISLVWGTPVGNWIFAGYHVWRDGVQIATTTSTMYADTNLLASTTYSYYVTAFDTFSNESASSTEIATSTYATPLLPPQTGTRVRWFQNEPVSIVVLPEQDSVVIRYETNDYIQSTIKWGKAISYELGSLLEQSFEKFHETRISGLSPGTKYNFTIEGLNRFNKYGKIYTGEFTTLPPEDTFPPNNISDLTAVRSGEHIELTWTNPTDVDFDKVRIVRNNIFYPSDIADGWVLYEGDATTVLDKDVPFEDAWRYYTVFSYDELGNISSGAVVRIYLGDDPFDASVDDMHEIDPEKNDIALSLSDVVFKQGDKVLEVQNDWSVQLDGSKQLSIEVPYEKVPEHLKTILVVLRDSEDADKFFKFLLRINRDKTAYVSTLAPFGKNGTYPLSLAVFDFKTAQVGYVDGILLSRIISTPHDQQDQIFVLKLIRTLFSSYIFWGIILLILITYLSKRILRAEW